jgi:hypothetical protein
MKQSGEIHQYGYTYFQIQMLWVIHKKEPWVVQPIEREAKAIVTFLAVGIDLYGARGREDEGENSARIYSI